MFSGCFTTFTGNWILVPVIDKSIQTEVEQELETQATAAIDAQIPLIWLYWPYSDPDQADDIFNVLKDVESRLKKRMPIKRLSRWAIAPTYVAHDRKAKSAILHVRVVR